MDSLERLRLKKLIRLLDQAGQLADSLEICIGNGAEVGRDWSLLDIMNRFDLDTLNHLTHRLYATWYACELKKRLSGGGSVMSPDFLDDTKKLAAEVESFCIKVGFENADVKTSSSSSHLEAGGLNDASAVGTEVRNIIEAMIHDAQRFCFLQVDHSRAGHIDNERLLGKAVIVAFPSAAFDIREAGNCLAAECNTAAVFHLMRTVEWGMRALCVDLGFRHVKSKIKKSGTVVYTPLEYLEWEKLLNEIQTKVDVRLTQLKRGNTKQILQEFYYPIIQDIKGFRDAWRNHVMHTRREYTSKDADAILEHVRRFMNTLSSRVAEV